MSFEDRITAARERVLQNVDLNAQVRESLASDLRVAQERRNNLNDSELERRLQEVREQFYQEQVTLDTEITELGEAVNHLAGEYAEIQG